MRMMFRNVLLASGAILVLQAGAALAQEDADAYIAQVTAPSAAPKAWGKGPKKPPRFSAGISAHLTAKARSRLAHLR